MRPFLLFFICFLLSHAVGDATETQGFNTQVEGENNATVQETVMTPEQGSSEEHQDTEEAQAAEPKEGRENDQVDPESGAEAGTSETQGSQEQAQESEHEQEDTRPKDQRTQTQQNLEHQTQEQIQGANEEIVQNNRDLGGQPEPENVELEGEEGYHYGVPVSVQEQSQEQSQEQQPQGQEEVQSQTQESQENPQSQEQSQEQQQSQDQEQEESQSHTQTSQENPQSQEHEQSHEQQSAGQEEAQVTEHQPLSELPYLDSDRDECQFDTRVLGQRTYLFSRKSHSYNEAVSMCRRCVGTQLADIHAASVFDTVKDASHDTWWVGSYNSGEIVPNLIFGTGSNPFVVVVEENPDTRRKFVCTYGTLRRTFCPYMIIDSAIGKTMEFPVSAPFGQNRGPCWQTSVRDCAGEIINGASANICFADFNATDFSTKASTFTAITTINLPNNNSFMVVSEVTLSSIMSINAGSMFTHTIAASNSVAISAYKFGIRSELGTGTFQSKTGAVMTSGFIDFSKFSENSMKLRFNEMIIVDWETDVACY